MRPTRWRKSILVHWTYSMFPFLFKRFNDDHGQMHSMRSKNIFTVDNSVNFFFFFSFICVWLLLILLLCQRTEVVTVYRTESFLLLFLLGFLSVWVYWSCIIWWHDYVGRSYPIFWFDSMSFEIVFSCHFWNNVFHAQKSSYHLIDERREKK